MKWIRSLQLLGLVLVAAAIPACLSNNPNRAAPQPGQPGAATAFKATLLSGTQEVPPVLTAGTGTATVSVAGTGSSLTITVTVDVSGLSSITEAHLHVGPPRVDGPIIFSLASASFTSPLTVTLTSADLLPAPAQGVSTFDQAVLAIQNGNTYVNVHTLAFPDGEIRGQVGTAAGFATLTGAQEVPAVLTLATGTMSLSLTEDQTSISIALNEVGISNVTAAHIHVAPGGIDGPIIFVLAENFYQVPLSVTLTAANFIPRPAVGINTFEEAVNAILSGNTYVNVHTAENPDGEIRGQIIPQSVTGSP